MNIAGAFVLGKHNYKESIMQIIYKKLSELKPYKNNPRKNEQAVKAVAVALL